jgi:ABC-type uncharacterized transport system substrate-binding protein
LSGPREAAADFRAGRVVVTFVRELATPFRPEDGTVAKVYDPTYFAAYAVTAEPRLEGRAEGCRAEVEPFRPNARLVALQRELSAVPIDEDPAQDLGALFAATVRVACD